MEDAMKIIGRYQTAKAMTEILAPVLSIAAVGLVLVSRWWYLRRIRQGRVNPVVDPSWPTIARPTLTELPDPPSPLVAM